MTSNLNVNVNSSLNLERELKRFIRQIRPGLIGGTSNPNVNLSGLMEELKSSPELVESLKESLRLFLASRDFTVALTETGLTIESGMFSEIFRRIEYKFLPKPVENDDILSFLRRIFDAISDTSWLESIDRELFEEFLLLILPPHESVVEPLASQFFLSLEILSLRLAGLGYEPIVTDRLRARREFQHAFMDVTRNVHFLFEKGESAIPALLDSLERCEKGVRWIRSRRGVDGISLALTYRLLKIQQVIHRMRLLIQLLQSVLSEWTPKPAIELFFEIMLAELRRFELRPFLASNVELLAFQITEHTGRAGEHYITRSRSEWWDMGWSAALGGAIVAVIAIVKILVSRLHLAPLPEALAYGLTYAIGFITIHSLGGTLATKQPAMTASTLAAALDESANSSSSLDGLAEIIVCTTRSQMIALLGNFFVAFPVAVMLIFPFSLIHLNIIPQDKAIHTLESLHGFHSLSFFYAALAGVCLFLSGLLAGVADNWFNFNHVGERLKHSELLRQYVPSHKLDRAIQVIYQNLGFWVGNISLGFFLGSMPAIGTIIGLPLDIRHITFASAQFGASLAVLDFSTSLSTAAVIGASIFIMGLVNLAVSFSLTLFVVIRSRKIRFAQTPLLLSKLGERFRRRPLDFFFPAGEST